MVINFPNPLAFNPSAILIALYPMNVPVSTINRGFVVSTMDFRKSKISSSELCESTICHHSGCGHSGVAPTYSG